MNAIAAAFSAASVAGAFWAIAASAARGRQLAIGSLPAALLPLAAICGALAARSGAHASEICILAGVAVAGWADARTGFIFDPINAALLAVSFCFAIYGGDLANALLGACAVGTTLYLVRALTHGRGLGLGDVKLGAAVATALGATSGFCAIGTAFIFGGTYGAWLLATKRARVHATIRFGPFIAAGTIVTIIAAWGRIK